MSTVSDPGAVTRRIPLSIPCTGERERQYLNECIETNWVSTVGPFVDRFEDELKKQTGAAHAVAVASGTAALHTALLCAGLEPEDEVVVSTLSFIASANAIRYTRAFPAFIDAESTYWQIDPALVEDFLAHQCTARDGRLFNKQTGRRIGALMPVHILGHPADLDPLLALARKYNLPLVEDAAEAVGTQYKGQPVGHHGDVVCFSFNGNKLVTAGGGGAVLTDDEALAHRARYLTTTAKDGALEFIHNEVGYNYRLTNLQAAVACAQLERLEEFIRIRREHAAHYRELLQDTPLELFSESPDAVSTFWLSAVKCADGSALQICRELKAAGIEARPLWQPLHLSPAHHGSYAMTNGVSERLTGSVVCLPSSSNLTAADREYVAMHLRRIAG